MLALVIQVGFEVVLQRIVHKLTLRADLGEYAKGFTSARLRRQNPSLFGELPL